MLRTLVIALAIGAPAASAQQFPDSAIGAPVVADDGTVLGEVTAVERNADGEIVSAELQGGLEPASAPYASSDLVAENERDQSWIPASARDDESASGGASRRTATR